jgi:DNA-binding beta-propeller fold protein YncE
MRTMPRFRSVGVVGVALLAAVLSAQPPSRSTLSSLSGVGLGSVSLSGRAPQGLDVDLETGLVYVSNNGAAVAACQPGPGIEGTMSVVDPASMRETASAQNLRGAVWPLVDLARNVVYSANSGGKSLTVHARGTGALIATIPLGGRPHQVGLDPASPLLVVSNTNDESQTFVALVNADTRTLVGHAAVAPLPHGVSVDRARHIAYVSSVSDGTNTLVDLLTGTIAGTLTTTTVANPNSNLNAFSEALSRLFVANSREGVLAFDASGVRLGAFGLGTPAWGMQVDDASGLLYAALPGQGAIGVVDALTLQPLALIPVDGCPFAVRLDTVRRLGFSTSMSTSRLSIFDLERVEAALRRRPL